MISNFVKSVLFMSFLLSGSAVFCQTNTWITGKIADHQNETISLNPDDFCFLNGPAIAETTIDDSGHFSLKFVLIEPAVLRLFNRAFYVIPGDSVFLNTAGTIYNPENIDVTGRNSDHYNYCLCYDSIKRKLPFNPYKYDFEKGLDNYRDSLAINKEMLMNHLKNFGTNHMLTNEFISYGINQISYNYYDMLLFPIVSKKIPLDAFSPKYIKSLDEIELIHDDLTGFRDYIFTANDFMVFKNQQMKGCDRYTIINDHSSGLTREFLLTDYAYSLVWNYESKNSLFVKNEMIRLDSAIRSDQYKLYYEIAKRKINKMLDPLPNDVLNSVMIDEAGNKHSFKELLGESKERILVIDFWASWCGSCVHGMPVVNQIKQNFINSNVDFIFISLDKTEAEWRNKLEKIQINGSHYLAVSNFQSALSKYLDITTIPRYVIINKTGKIEKIEAAYPSSDNRGLSGQIAKLLNE